MYGNQCSLEAQSEIREILKYEIKPIKRGSKSELVIGLKKYMTLIKVVLQSLSTYVMAVFKILADLMEDLSHIFHDF
jgi:hypothetical protein